MARKVKRFNAKARMVAKEAARRRDAKDIASGRVTEHALREQNALRCDVEVELPTLVLDADSQRRLAQLDAAIARGIADADAGRVHDIDDVRREMRERFRSKDPT
jgi:hypothetical protein